MDSKLFKYYMSCNNDNEYNLADALKIHRVTLNNKINGKAPFKLDEVNIIRKRYNLTFKQFYNVFLV